MPVRIVVALALALTAGASCRPGPTAEERLDLASRAMRQGDLARALSLADPSAAARPETMPDELRLLAAEIRLMQRDLPAARALIDTPLSEGPDRNRFEARRDYLNGYEQVARRQFDRATATLDAAARRARAAGAASVEFAAEALHGQALYRLGHATEADDRLATALERARQTADVLDDATLLVTAGMGRLSSNRFDEALTFFEPVMAMSSIAGDMLHATALSNAGVSYARLGEFDKAIEVQTRAVAEHEDRQVPIYIEQSQGELGNTYALMDQPAKALPYLTRARTVAAAGERWTDAALWTDNLAIAHLNLGQWDRADALNEESAALKARSGDTSLVFNTLARARVAAGRGQLDRAITLFEATLAEAGASPYAGWQAHGGLAEALLARGQRARGLAEFNRALALIDLARTDLPRLEHRFSFLARMIGLHRAYVEALVNMGDSDGALEVADLSRARVLAERTGGGAVVRTAASAFGRAAARSGTTLVSYWLGRTRSHAWIVTSAGVRRVDLPPAETIDALVARHRQFIERSIANPLGTPSGPADALAEAVLEPVRAHIAPHARVVVVPDGSLHGVNFETLPIGSPRHYWIEDVTLTVAPSLALVSSGRPAAKRGTGGLLVMGDAVEGAGTGPRLQHAGREIDAILSRFPTTRSTVRRGAEARPEAYAEAKPGAYSVIHFAAHATANALSPLDSTIELSAGTAGASKLYAREIASQPLSADLVTISACRGVGDRAYGGEGPVGLAWAFMRAGAARVIAGLWDVDDATTATIMMGLYDGLARGDDPAVALRAAKLAVIRRGGTAAKPFYWAPLQVFTTHL